MNFIFGIHILKIMFQMYVRARIENDLCEVQHNNRDHKFNYLFIICEFLR